MTPEAQRCFCRGRPVRLAASERVEPGPDPLYDPDVVGGASGTFDRLGELRAHSPTSQLAHGLFFVTSYDDTARVLSDPDRFSGRHAGRSVSGRVTMFEEDPDGHGPRRRIFARAIGGSRSRRLREFSRSTAERLLAPCVRAGHAEVVGDIAEPVTRQVIGELLGIEPEQQPRVYALVATLQHERLSSRNPSATSRRTAAAEEFRTWVLDHAARHQTAAVDPDAALLSLRRPDAVTGYHLTDDEFVMDAQQLCQSGTGATRLLISNVILRLAIDQQLFARVKAEPDVVPSVIEESLRHDTPVRLAKRTCMALAAIGDLTVEAGAEVLTSLTSANRDERHFDHSETFDIDRDQRHHLAFGSGPHRCPGAAVARLVAGEVISTLAVQVEAMTLPDDFVYEGQPFLDGLRFHGPRELPVSLIATHPATSAPS